MPSERLYKPTPDVVSYTYLYKPVRVIDGDTVEGVIDLGFSVRIKQRFRLAGIDTPELRPRYADFETEELRDEHIKQAYAALCFVQDRSQGMQVIQTVRDTTGKFGRYLCWIWPYPYKIHEILSDTPPLTLNELLVMKGLAEPTKG